MTTLRSTMLGSWELAAFETRDLATGAVRQPLGSEPRGVILYTEDGYMSAQLAPGSEDAELGGLVGAGPLARGTTPLAVPGGYIAYTGPFHVDEQASIVHHEVAMATMPDLLAAPQLREVSVDGETLTLSATMTDDTGTTTRSTLTWRRPNR